MRGWYRATTRHATIQRFNRWYHDTWNLYLCPECGERAEEANTYWKIVKRKQEVFAPVCCHDCGFEAPPGEPKVWKRPKWREP